MDSAERLPVQASCANKIRLLPEYDSSTARFSLAVKSYKFALAYFQKKHTKE
jgi:hypothetical protein